MTDRAEYGNLRIECKSRLKFDTERRNLHEPEGKILRTELVSAGAALLCCLLLCIACFLLAGLPSASLILLAAALPLSLVILPCALTWYSGRFCWAAPIFLTLGFILIPSYFLRGYFLEIGLAGLASGLFAAAVQGSILRHGGRCHARRGRPMAV